MIEVEERNLKTSAGLLRGVRGECDATLRSARSRASYSPVRACSENAQPPFLQALASLARCGVPFYASPDRRCSRNARVVSVRDLQLSGSRLGLFLGGQQSSLPSVHHTFPLPWCWHSSPFEMCKLHSELRLPSATRSASLAVVESIVRVDLILLQLLHLLPSQINSFHKFLDVHIRSGAGCPPIDIALNCFLGNPAQFGLALLQRCVLG